MMRRFLSALRARLSPAQLISLAVLAVFAAQIPIRSVAARFAAALSSAESGASRPNAPAPAAQAPVTEPVPTATPEDDQLLVDPDVEGETAENDADLPHFIKGRINKAEYMRGRAGYVAMMRGLDSAKPDSRAKALRVMAQQEAAAGRLARSRGVLGPSAWTFVGPNPIPNGQTTAVSSAVSGRVSAIAVDPGDKNVVWAGAAQGGVYRSLDGGTTWTQMLDGVLGGGATMAIGAIAVAPSDPTIVYIGTGEASASADGFIGVGIYRITAAKSGSPVVEGPFNQDGAAADVMTFRSVSKILVHPTDPATIFVTTASGTGGNPQSFPVVLPARGLYRSVNATAVSPVFSKLVVNPTNNVPMYDAVLEPGNPNNLLVTVNAAVADGGVWRTTNALAPAPVFTQTQPLASVRAELAINSVMGTVTVLVASGETVGVANGCSATVQGSVRKSVDGGTTWSAQLGDKSRGFCNAQCFYDIFVGIDPGDANRIYLGGGADSGSANVCRSSISQRSTDGGATFTRNSNALHADSHALAIAPSDPTVIYTGNDGGIFKSVDQGATWTSLNNSFFSATQFQSIAVHPRDAKFTIGGTQDNGTNGMNSAGTWNRVDFGDGGYALIDQNAFDTTSMTMYHTYFNQANSIIGFARVLPGVPAVEGGWTFLGFNGTPNGIVNQNVQFYAPIALGPGNPNTLYFAGDRLYRSIDRGTSMVQVSQQFGGFIVTTIGISPQDDNFRIVGRNDGKLWGTTTGTNPLTDLGVGNVPALPAKPATRVVIDPNNTSVAYATYSGFGLGAGQHVWKTTSFGTAATWTVSGTGIPDVPVDSIVVDPQDSNRVYAGTDIGVYASSDAGATWAPLGIGLPRVAVFDLAIQSPNRILRIATHGRGMWELLLPGPITPVVMLSLASSSPGVVTGNNNAFIEPGETASLSTTLANAIGANTSATAVSGTLTTSTVGVSIVNGSSAYPDLAPGATGSNTTPLTFSLSPMLQCGAVVTLPLSVSYTGDAASPRSFTIKVPTGQPSGSTTTIPYAGAPVFIPDSPAPAVTATLPVAGIPGAISKVKFSIDGTACNTTPASTTVGLDHTFVGDLQIRLTSPMGTVIRLTSGNGGAGINFCNTVFDDAAATSITSVTAAQNPFTGSFRPVDPLSSFAGEDPNGTWVVSMVDTGAIDTGTMRAFSLLVEPAACAAIPPPPVVTTDPATSIDYTSATLNGTVNPNSRPTTGFFEYGLTAGYGSTTPPQNLGSGALNVPLSNAISGLTCGTTYHYRAVGMYAIGRVNGLDAMFTTTACRQLSISDVTMMEGNSGFTNAVFTVSLSGVTGGTVTVNFATSDGTAKATKDYTPTSGTLTFNPGQSTKTINVPVVGDLVFESDETFTVTLSGASGALILDGTGAGTITNDDRKRYYLWKQKRRVGPQ